MLVTEYDDFIRLIKEGLILTHDIHQSENVLKKHLLEIGVKNVINIRDNNTLELTVYNKINQDLLYIIMSLTNNLGYYPSRVYLKTKNMDYEYKFDYEKLLKDLNKNIIELKFVLESTFDIKIDTPKVLYHVTRKSYLDKIFKIGLIAKSGEKITYHPERIYYSFKLSDCYGLIKRFEHNDKLNPNKLIDFRNKKGYNIKYYEFDILKIDTEGLKLNLYKDPNFSEKGCYGYDNIPPNKIKIM